MTKQEARKVFKQNRAQLSRRDLLKMNDLLLIQFQRLILPYVNVIHSFIPLQDQKEPDPILMIDYLKFKNVNMKVVYPKIDPENFSMKNIVDTGMYFFIAKIKRGNDYVTIKGNINVIK
jgi:5-formyltetrahydrofolate cyclo-ligase